MPTSPTNVTGVLLDIEGTTSSISFVHDVMFPFVLDRLDTFLAEHFTRGDVQAACETIAQDAGHASLAAWQAAQSTVSAQATVSAQELVAQEVRKLMANDVKATGLKALQGLIWQVGFQAGELTAHVYPDVLPAIETWRAGGLDVRIYSSGSIAAQKLFFGHLEDAGNCLHLFSGHYDTTFGGKKEADSYRRIAADWGKPLEEILFVTDIAEEATAAIAAGAQVAASVRPGNASLPPDLNVPLITSFAELSLLT
ncbi:acireductone synthase [Aureliella helgolandensis]|uniref:Enolase-phosphatase E1 n=1 Tax=Aureliella helgolandensis TaxID=2527968 RepID=A0A518GFU0_9BACT|nr:acireductone synthase [Aureliella helgolandensis]QDV27408.1 Enolase-phosphatase E1 [Aureliella helgolandensis]